MKLKRRAVRSIAGFSAAGLPFVLGQGVAHAENPTQDSATQTVTFTSPLSEDPVQCTLHGFSNLFEPEDGAPLRGAVVSQIPDSEQDPACRTDLTVWATAGFVDSSGDQEVGSAVARPGTRVEYFTNDVRNTNGQFTGGHLFQFGPGSCNATVSQCTFTFETQPAQPK